MNPFQQIPANVRKWLYVAYGVVGLVLGGFQVAQQDTILGADVVTCLAVLAYVGMALGFTAASNISDPQTVAVSVPGTAVLTTNVDATFGPEEAPRDERGGVDIVTIFYVLGILFFALGSLWLLGADTRTWLG